MYQTCVIHAPIPCKVMDNELHGYCVHDRYQLPESDDEASPDSEADEA